MNNKKWLQHMLQCEGQPFELLSPAQQETILAKHQNCSKCIDRRNTQKATQRKQEREAVYIAKGLVRKMTSTGKPYWG